MQSMVQPANVRLPDAVQICAAVRTPRVFVLSHKRPAWLLVLEASGIPATKTYEYLGSASTRLKRHLLGPAAQTPEPALEATSMTVLPYRASQLRYMTC